MNQYMDLIGKNARKASLGKINTKIKNKVLKKYVLLIDKEKNLILRENAKDIKFSYFYKKLNVVSSILIIFSIFILLFNSSINIFSQIALIILIGISTKNSILLKGKIKK